MANDKLDYVETGERQSVDCSPRGSAGLLCVDADKRGEERGTLRVGTELSQCVCYVSGVEGECRRRKRLHLFGEGARRLPEPDNEDDLQLYCRAA